MRQEFDAWKRTVTRGDSTRAIAEQLNTNGPRIKRHLEESNPPVAETVIELARAYGANPVDGLLAAGLLTRGEVGQAAAKDTVSAIPMLQLLEEAVARERKAVARRVTRDARETAVAHAETPAADADTDTEHRLTRRRAIGEGML